MLLVYLLTLKAFSSISASNPESTDVGFIPPPRKKDCSKAQRMSKRVMGTIKMMQNIRPWTYLRFLSRYPYILETYLKSSKPRTFRRVEAANDMKPLAFRRVHEVKC